MSTKVITVETDWPEFFLAADATAQSISNLTSLRDAADAELERARLNARHAREQLEKAQGFGRHLILTKLQDHSVTITEGRSVGVLLQDRHGAPRDREFVPDSTELAGRTGIIQNGGDLSREWQLHLSGFGLAITFPGDVNWYLIRPKDCQLTIGERQPN